MTNKVVYNECMTDEQCVLKIDDCYFGYDKVIVDCYPETLHKNKEDAYVFANPASALKMITWLSGKVFKILPVDDYTSSKINKEEHKMTDYEKINKIHEKIDEYTEKISSLQSELKELKKSHWSFSSDEKKLGDLSIECNFETWREAKADRKEDKVFYLGINESSYEESVEFNLEEAKMIAKYINEKVEFMESM